MKRRRSSPAKKAVNQPRFRSRVEKPAKGAGSYQRKPKQPPKPGTEEEV